MGKEGDSMKTIPIRATGRFMKRRINEAIGHSYAKAVSEPLTNSDESYKHLDKSIQNTGGEPPKRETDVYVNRSRETFEIVDMAEGMSAAKMEELFEGYGAEKATHTDEGRGLFGKGLADVLLSQNRGGFVSSIKDDKLTVAEFRWQRKTDPSGKNDDEMVVKLGDPSNATKEDRERLHIHQGNGTHVSFKFKFEGSHFPQRDKMIARLSNYYILRLINSSPNRIVKVIFLDKKGREEKEDVLTFSWPKGEVLGVLDTEMNFEGYKIGVHGELSRADEPLPQKDKGEDRVGGLLVYDTNGSVLDLTLFDFDGVQYADHFFGKLELNGAYKIIRDRMNQAEPEEILTDSRDGFKQGHEFTIQLAKIVNAWLQPFVEDEKKKRARGGAIDEETTARTHKAFEILNKIYADINKEVRGIAPGRQGGELPENGLEFDRRTVEIAVNERYRIGLRVDANVFRPGTTISITAIDPLVEAAPGSLTVDVPKEGKAVVSMGVFLIGRTVGAKANVTAACGTVTSVLEVSVVEEDRFYPANGMEFNPKTGKAKPNNWGGLDLYVDTAPITLGSSVQLSVSGDVVLVKDQTISVLETNRVYDNVAKLRVEYRGTGEGQKATVTASFGSYTAQAFITIRTSSPQGAGLFKGWEFEEREGDVSLAFFDLSDGIIRLNLAHPILLAFFGRNMDEAKKRYKEQLHCQVVVADIVLEEFLYFTMSKAYGENKLDRVFAEEPWSDVKRYTVQKKSEFGKAFFEAFVDKKLLAEAIGNAQEGIVAEEKRSTV
jgi:hypothetical protein